MRNIQQLLVALFVSTLVACSGGGTIDSGGGGGNTPVYSVSVNLTNAAGQNATALSQASPLTATVTLSATNSGSVANKLISFTFNDAELATLSNTAGTALTDTNGVATIGLLVGSKSGAGTLTATYGTVNAEAGFNSAGDGGDDVGVTIGSVKLIADSLMLGSGAASKVELSALVRDNNNVVLKDVPVVFSTDSGELVQIDAVTAENGVAKATLSTQTDRNIRDIKVLARVQQQSDTVVISVVGTSLQLAAPTSVVLGDTANVDIFLTDSDGNGIQGQQISVSSALGNTLSNASPVTVGGAGKASFTYTAVSSGTDTLTVSALGATNMATVNISADAFAFEADPTEKNGLLEVELGEPKAVAVEWLVDGEANIGEQIVFNTTRGEVADSAQTLSEIDQETKLPVDPKVTSSGSTDDNGVATTVVRSFFAGMATISAEAGDGESMVSASKVIEFVATNPTQVEVQAFPAQIGPGETSAVRAIVRDERNNPVKNKTVVFSLDNSAGGAISAGTAVTNSQGIASTVFTADANTGAGVDGENLVIKAAVQDKDNKPVVDQTDIAVGKRTLFFRFGTGNAITKPNASTYEKEFSIIVTDSSGNPVANQALNVAVVSIGYRKGYWVKAPPAPAAFKNWAPLVTSLNSMNGTDTCASEDANFNGILDEGEDINDDKVLTPGNVVSVQRTVAADENGIATFKLTYPQDHAVWTDVRLQVSGFAAGTENISHRPYTLAISAEDVTNEASPPPANPYGVKASCSDPS